MQCEHTRRSDFVDNTQGPFHAKRLQWRNISFMSAVNHSECNINVKGALWMSFFFVIVFSQREYPLNEAAISLMPFYAYYGSMWSIRLLMLRIYVLIHFTDVYGSKWCGSRCFTDVTDLGVSRMYHWCYGFRCLTDVADLGVSWMFTDLEVSRI